MPNNLRRFRILGNEKEKRKSQYGVKIRASVQFPLRNLLFGNSGQTLRKSRYQTFRVSHGFTCFSYFWQNILSLIVWKTQYLAINSPSLLQNSISLHF